MCVCVCVCVRCLVRCIKQVITGHRSAAGGLLSEGSLRLWQGGWGLGTVKTPTTIYSIYGDIKGDVPPNIKTHTLLSILYYSYALYTPTGNYRVQLTGEWCCSLSFHHREAVFFLSFSIISVHQFCQLLCYSGHQRHSSYCVDNNKIAYQCMSCYFFLPHGEFHFIVLILDIVPVTTRNILMP